MKILMTCVAVSVWGGADSSCTDFDCPESCPSDVDGDGDVGVSDILMLIAAWGACP